MPWVSPVGLMTTSPGSSTSEAPAVSSRPLPCSAIHVGVDEQLVRRGAVPVDLAQRDPHAVAWMERPQRAALELETSDPRLGDQDLAAGVMMPENPRARA